MATRKNNRTNPVRTTNTVAAVRRITNRVIAGSTVACSKTGKVNDRLYTATRALDKIIDRYAEGNITTNTLFDTLYKIRDTLDNIGSDLADIQSDLADTRNDAIYDLDQNAGKTSVL